MSTPAAAAAAAAKRPSGESTASRLSVATNNSNIASGGSNVIHGTMNWEPVRQRLLGPDLKDAYLAATELREGIEIVHTTEFPLMLSALLPGFSSILAHKTRPSADTNSMEHKLRNAVLEIISRMPSNEVLRPHAPHLVALAIDILNRDYEDNALLASRIIFDLYKVYRSLPQDYVQPYLDFVQASYRSLPAAVQRNFAMQPSPSQEHPSAASPVPANATTASNASATESTSKNTTTTAAADPATTAQTTQQLSPIPAAAGANTAKTPASTAANAPASASSPPKGTGTSNTNTTPTGTTAATTAIANTPDSLSSISPMGGLNPASPRPRLALRSNSSFRVLVECPLCVMLMFQLYPKFLKSNIPVLINVMMEALSLRAPPMQSLVPSNTTIDPSNKRLYFSRARELVAAQAKTLSFLTYLLRGFSNELKPYEDRLASNVVALMSTCPRESISTRKELLVATRHLLNSEFRTGFYPHVDALLDERVLMGCNHRYSEQTALRPLGYTALSDLVHHVKTGLTMAQMSKVVCMFSRILHDSSSTLPLSTQYTAVRTLLSVVEIIFQNKDSDPQIGRDMLVRILSTLVNKLSTLNEYFSAVKKSDGGKDCGDDDDNSNNGDVGGNNDSELVLMNLAASPYAPLAFADDDHHHAFLSDKGDLRERNTSFDGNVDVSDSLRDLRSMIRAIVVGHKTVIWYINNYRSQREKDKPREKATLPSGSNEEVSSAMLKMTNSERALVDKYILLAIPCMKFLKDGNEAGVKPNKGKSTPSDQYRDVLSYFAAAFTTLDGYDLKRTFGRRLDVLVDAIVDDQAVMVVPRHLLGSNATTSYEFSSILLRYLVERMDDLRACKSSAIRFFGPSLGLNLRDVESHNVLLEEALHPEKEPSEKTGERAVAYLQLFERVLKSLTVYPDNEGALRPHLRRIVATCLRSSMENAGQWPDNYCMLLRYVFRSISAGKFEESYKELLPLIPAALNGLYRVIIATQCSLIKHTIIELCLTIPARLSSLLPHMNLLLRVIVQALSSHSGDLVNLGLRTLEFWIDNLNPDFLYPELSKQTSLFTDLMQALSRHLKPAPYPYGLLSLRLLGKLGGKNRRFLREPMDVCTEEKVNGCPQAPISIRCEWAPPQLPLSDSQISDSETTVLKGSFFVPLPLERCVGILKLLAATEDANMSNSKNLDKTIKRPSSVREENQILIAWKDSKKLWDMKVEEVDFAGYCSDVMEQSLRHQARSAFRIIRAALAGILDTDSMVANALQIVERAEIQSAMDIDDDTEGNEESMSLSSHDVLTRNNHFLQICFGLMYSCLIESTKEDGVTMLEGIASYIFYLVLTHENSFARIDANGSKIADDLGEWPEASSIEKDEKQEMGEADGGSSDKDEASASKEEQPKASSPDKEGDKEQKVGANKRDEQQAAKPVSASEEYERLGSLKPFGYFHPDRGFLHFVNPLLFNEAIADFLATASGRSTDIVSRVVRKLLQEAKSSSSPKGRSGHDSATLHRGARVFFENLLSNLCMSCFSNEWNRRYGLQEIICVVLEGLGSEWGLKYESEVMDACFFVLKSVPRELSSAAVDAFGFFVRCCCSLYGKPRPMQSEDHVIWDSLKSQKDVEKRGSDSATRTPCSAVLHVVFNEMASPKQIVR